MSWYILDEQHRPRHVDALTAGSWMQEHDEQRLVASDVVAPGIRVSTVFLCLDHGYGDRVLLYETMVFGGPLDLGCERYTTREEALEGHAHVLEMVRVSASGA